jgi:hypothetical protein
LTVLAVCTSSFQIMLTSRACPFFPIPAPPHVKCTFCMYSETTIDRLDSKTSPTTLLALVHTFDFFLAALVGRNRVFYGACCLTQTAHKPVKTSSISQQEQMLTVLHNVVRTQYMQGRVIVYHKLFSPCKKMGENCNKTLPFSR